MCSRTASLGLASSLQGFTELYMSWSNSASSPAILIHRCDTISGTVIRRRASVHSSRRIRSSHSTRQHNISTVMGVSRQYSHCLGLVLVMELSVLVLHLMSWSHQCNSNSIKDITVSMASSLEGTHLHHAANYNTIDILCRL